MNKIKLLIGLIVILIVTEGYSQMNYSVKAETGFLKYQFNTIQVDPGLNWKGYNLNEENGVDLNITNGIKYKEKFYTGVGIGYLFKIRIFNDSAITAHSD